jgi:uncharacterized SAM-binding protein YcdF (DUF218 family)
VLPSILRPRGSFRRVLLIAAVVTAAGSGWAVYRLGSLLSREDPLQRADTIFVFAGTRMERALEAAELYLEGYAPSVVLTEEVPDGGVAALEDRGFDLLSHAEMSRDMMVRLGVPSDAILIAPGLHNSTAAEARTLRSLARLRGWRRIILVTSKFHTRRAGLAAGRELSRMGTEIILRGSRYDPADPAHWWRTRRDARSVAVETQKLVAYWLRLSM